MEIDGLIQSLAKMNETPWDDADYEMDGLLYCGHCETAKQCRIEIGGKQMIVPCSCACKERAREAKLKAIKADEMRMRIDELRRIGIADKRIADCTFENAEQTRSIEKAKRYVDRWDDMKADNIGLMFWGGVGGGKSYAAACIANAMIARGVSAVVTSVPDILNAKYDERTDIIDKLCRCQLLVLDDLGAERQNEFSLETIFNIIDKRYKAKLPIIVTTNLSAKELDNPTGVEYKRIYDRLGEMCVKICFDGESRRKETAKGKLDKAKELFS